MRHPEVFCQDSPQVAEILRRNRLNRVQFLESYHYGESRITISRQTESICFGKSGYSREAHGSGRVGCSTKARRAGEVRHSSEAHCPSEAHYSSEGQCSREARCCR
jgi:hypothetical protein